jgi:hypothetical protein
MVQRDTGIEDGVAALSTLWQLFCVSIILVAWRAVCLAFRFPLDKVQASMPKVFLRPRPLAASEQGDAVVAYTADESGGVHVVDAGKKFSNFAGVLSTENSAAYEEAIKPLVPGMLGGSTSCCFAYGHTNSDKTHTIFGYGAELGMCQRLVQDLFAESDGELLVQVRF